MPTIEETFQELRQVNTHLEGLRAETRKATQCCEKGFADILAILHDFGIISRYMADGLAHASRERQAMICVLEHVSEQTCGLLNSAQAELIADQDSASALKHLREVFSEVHSGAALSVNRALELRRRIEECCPPAEREPACVYQPCEAPTPLVEPPEVMFESTANEIA